MHDWSDVCTGFPRRCRHAGGNDERVVVIDAVVPPGNAPHPVGLLRWSCRTVASAPGTNLLTCLRLRA
jgi:hypothetical protein